MCCIGGALPRDLFLEELSEAAWRTAKAGGILGCKLKIRFGTRFEMELGKALEPTPEYYWIELGRMDRKLVEEFFPIQAGANVVITAGTESDWRVVQETARVVYALGASPTTDYPTSDSPSPVAGALQATDAWIDFESSYLLCSRTWEKAMEAGVRYLAIAGDVDSLVRMAGRADSD